MNRSTSTTKTRSVAVKSNGGPASNAAHRRSAGSPLERGSRGKNGNGVRTGKVITTGAVEVRERTSKARAPATKLMNVAEPMSVATKPTTAAPRGKLGVLVGLLRNPTGATLSAMMTATGWQAHSVRGAMAGALKKKLGMNIVSEMSDKTRTWRIVEDRA